MFTPTPVQSLSEFSSPSALQLPVGINEGLLDFELGDDDPLSGHQDFLPIIQVWFDIRPLHWPFLDLKADFEYARNRLWYVVTL